MGQRPDTSGPRPDPKPGFSSTMHNFTDAAVVDCDMISCVPWLEEHHMTVSSIHKDGDGRCWVNRVSDTGHRSTHWSSHALVIALVFGVNPLSHADRTGNTSNQPPPPSLRCRGLNLARVHTTYEDFQQAIVNWMATCVTSRTGEAHREVELVNDNRSLYSVWQNLAKGQPARIVPHYTWGTHRVVQVTFSSPQATARSSQANVSPTGRPPSQAKQQSGNGGNGPPPYPDTGGNAVLPPQPSEKPKPDAPRLRRPIGRPLPITPEFPNEADDLLTDARRLVQEMRKNGKAQEADQLEWYIATAAKKLGSLALLAGGYYVGVKLRAGRLLFAWGWNATGEHFTRVAGRLERLVPDAEKAIGEVINSARPHVPPAGSGFDWPVLDQVVNGTVPAQLDSMACGPACLVMILAERGIKLTQEELIRRVRATIPKGIKRTSVTIASLRGVLQRADPDGNWVGGEDIGAHILRGRTPIEVIQYLARKGSWIAQVHTHFVSSTVSTAQAMSWSATRGSCRHESAD